MTTVGPAGPGGPAHPAPVFTSRLIRPTGAAQRSSQHGAWGLPAPPGRIRAGPGPEAPQLRRSGGEGGSGPGCCRLAARWSSPRLGPRRPSDGVGSPPAPQRDGPSGPRDCRGPGPLPGLPRVPGDPRLPESGAVLPARVLLLPLTQTSLWEQRFPQRIYNLKRQSSKLPERPSAVTERGRRPRTALTPAGRPHARAAQGPGREPRLRGAHGAACPEALLWLALGADPAGAEAPQASCSLKLSSSGLFLELHL